MVSRLHSIQDCLRDPLLSTTIIETMTTTITFDFDVSAFGALRLAPGEFAREMRIAAAVQWYAQGIVSQGKAAELADEIHEA